MRVLVIIKANKDSENGVMPSQEALLAMGKFNEELVKAGIMLDGAGLRPSKDGARVNFSGDSRTVVDGPFPETKELIAGYWIWQVKDMQEAIEWVKRIPCEKGAPDSHVEIRRFFEVSDFEMNDATKQQFDKVASELDKKGTAHGVA